MLRLVTAAAAGCLIAGSALALEPRVLTDVEMDFVTAGSFVCPVITTDAVLNSPLGGGPLADGHYTVAPPGAGDLNVPIHATNKDGAGAPDVSGYATPGDTNYSAIWYE